MTIKNFGKEDTFTFKGKTFTADELASPLTPKVAYQERDKSSTSHLDMLRALELSPTDLEEVAAFSARSGIEFMSTPYSIGAVRILESIGVRRFKTASADIVDLPLHAAIAATGLPVLISTGMATNREIAGAIDIYQDPSNKVTILHAVSKYPTPLHEANLNRILRLRSDFGLKVGYSDHTSGYLAAATAVALGATIIEKHFTLDRTFPGPDHLASAEPDEFRQMVEILEQVESSLGTGEFQLQPEELEMSRVSRKSLHLHRAVSAGSVLTEDHLVLRRPGTGLQWSDREIIVGKTSRRNLTVGEILQVSDFQ